MGIYIFNWKVLREYLIADEMDKESENDFGKNIIPNMLNDGKVLYAYQFSGYWKDVGTVSSLWESNMDLLNPESGINLNDVTWKIYARTSAEPPHYASQLADIRNSIVSEGANVSGKVVNSIISHSAYVGKDAEIYDSVVLPGAQVMEGAKIRHAIIAEGAVIEKNALVGETQTAPVKGEWQIALVGPMARVKEGEKILPGQMVEEGK